MKKYRIFPVFFFMAFLIIAEVGCTENYEQWQFDQHKKTLAGSVETNGVRFALGRLNGLTFGEDPFFVEIQIKAIKGDNAVHIDISSAFSERRIPIGFGIYDVEVSSAELKGEPADVTIDCTSDLTIRANSNGSEYYECMGAVKGWLKNPQLYEIQTKFSPTKYPITGYLTIKWTAPSGESHTLIVEEILPL